jgi:hypothetical protein
MTDTLAEQKIPSEKWLRAQCWIGGALVPVLLAAFMVTFVGWIALLGLKIMPDPQAIPERVHETFLVTLGITPVFIVLAVAVWLLCIRSSRRRNYYYRTLVRGAVSSLQPKKYQCYAKVDGVNRAGQKMSDTFPVTVDKWSTLQEGDLYPWVD